MRRLRRQKEAAEADKTQSTESKLTSRSFKFQKRQTVYFMISIAGIMLFSLVILVVTGTFDDFDLGNAISQIFRQLINPEMTGNVLRYWTLAAAAIIASVISAAFLFEINITSSTFVHIQHEWYWKYFLRHLIIKDKHGWHIMIGYFVSILIFHPVIAEQVWEVQSRLQEINLYQAYIITIPVVSTILVVARVLSKLDLAIIDTNIGVLIVLIYVSEIIFLTVTLSFVPFEQLYGFVSYPNEAQNQFIIYDSEVFAASLCMLADWLIIRVGMNKDSF